MLNTIQLQENEKYSENKSRKLAKYDFLPVDLIAHEIYSALLNAGYNSDFLAEFDSIPARKINAAMKSYVNAYKSGLLTDMYVKLGIGIRDLKPRILRIINLVSFKDKEKRAIWKLYGEFNDFDDFIEEHNADIIKKIDNLLLQI